MKSTFKLLPIITVLFFVFGACAPTEKKDVKVGLLFDAFDLERWESDRDYIVERVEEQGGTVEVKVASNDAREQAAQANELLNAGVDVLVVIPVDQFAAAEIVEAAHQHNVKVISYDRLIKNCALDYYVSTDNVEIGSLQASYLTTIRPTGNYALIGGAMNDNNSQRKRESECNNCR